MRAHRTPPLFEVLMVLDVGGEFYRTELDVLPTTATRRKLPSLYASYLVPLHIVPILVVDDFVDTRRGH